MEYTGKDDAIAKLLRQADQLATNYRQVIVADNELVNAGSTALIMAQKCDLVGMARALEILGITEADEIMAERVIEETGDVIEHREARLKYVFAVADFVAQALEQECGCKEK